MAQQPNICKTEYKSMFDPYQCEGANKKLLMLDIMILYCWMPPVAVLLM